MAVPFSKMSPEQSIAIGTTYKRLTTGNCDPIPRCLVAETTVTVSFTDFDGNASTNVPMVAGQTILCAIRSIEALTGTLSGIS